MKCLSSTESSRTTTELLPWVSHCDLKSRNVPQFPPLLSNTFWQALAARARHSHTHTHTLGKSGSGNKKQFPYKPCLERRCRKKSFLCQTTRLVTGHYGFQLACQVQWVHPLQPRWWQRTVSTSICTGGTEFKALKKWSQALVFFHFLSCLAGWQYQAAPRAQSMDLTIHRPLHTHTHTQVF